MSSLERVAPPAPVRLRKRLLDITVKHNLSHLSSTWSALPIIAQIYARKRPDDIFVLSAGHAGLALYVVLEDVLGVDAEMLLVRHGIHPNRDISNGIHVSSGSLGCGLPIAVGYALADRSRDVFCLVSDGECAEGSIWESLAFIYSAKLDNCQVAVNINGQSAYAYTDNDYLEKRLNSFGAGITIYKSPRPSFPNSEGLKSHYQVINADHADEILRTSS